MDPVSINNQSVSLTPLTYSSTNKYSGGQDVIGGLANVIPFKPNYGGVIGGISGLALSSARSTALSSLDLSSGLFSSASPANSNQPLVDYGLQGFKALPGWCSAPSSIPACCKAPAAQNTRSFLS